MPIVSGMRTRAKLLRFLDRARQTIAPVPTLTCHCGDKFVARYGIDECAKCRAERARIRAAMRELEVTR